MILHKNSLFSLLSKIKATFSAIKIVWTRSKHYGEDNKEQLRLISLSPTSDCGQEGDVKAKKYFEAIDSALKDEDIYNIGIVGSYGSGKSSIIKSFAKKYDSYNVQYISLASFIDKQRNQSGGVDNTEQLLEYSIIQQILYSVTSNKLPKSRFKRIHSKICYWKPVFTSVPFLLSLVIVIEPCWLTNSSLWGLVTWDKGWMALGALVILLITITCIVIYLVFVIKMYKLSKISLKSGEIELNAPDERSILNRYLDELLYFFEKSNKNIIVIEDLDRYDRPNVFSKLREINLLINNYEPIRNKHKRVVFIYAVKDDMFKQSELRVKFFDLLIPIVPYVDAFNSADVFNKLISQSNIKIDSSMVYTILPFINDMRLLKNIYNELIVIEKIVSSDGKLWNQILPIVVYKNVYPDDFSLTHKGKGLINKIFSNESKKLLVEESTVVLNSNINKKEAEIDNINKKRIEDIKSLRDEYINALINLLDVRFVNRGHREDEQVKINGKFIDLEKLKEDALFDDLKELGITEFRFNSNSYECEITFDEIEEELKADKEYVVRYNTIVENSKTISELARYKIQDIKYEIDALNKKQIADLVNIVELGSIFKELECEDKKLAVSLFRNGYIKEDFYLYISIFVQGKFSPADNKFITSKASGSPVGYDFHIDNPKIIRKENMKSEAEYQNSHALNYDILKSFIDDNINSKEQWIEYTSMHYKYVTTILGLPYNNKYKFVDGFCKGYQTDVVSFFINYIIERENDFWSKITNGGDISTAMKWNMLSHLLTYANAANIQIISKDEQLCEFIKNSKEVVYQVGIDATENAKMLLEYINPKFDWGDFVDINTDGRNDELLTYIYENNMYAISEKMIAYMLRNYMSNYDSDKFSYACYTYIKGSQCNNLILYVDDNIEKFIKSVFLKMQTQQAESCDNFFMLCNHDSIKDDVANAIIDKTTTTIDDINSIKKNTLWNKLILARRIKHTWNNSVSYFVFVGETINDNLMSYMNDQYATIIDSGGFDFSNKQYRSFAIDILTTNMLECGAHQSLSMIMNNISIKRNDIGLTSQKENGIHKLQQLMQLGLIRLSESSIKALRDYANPLQIELLEMYPDNCVELTTRHKYIINELEKLTILKSNKLKEQQKIEIAYSVQPNRTTANELANFVLFSGVNKFTKEYVETIQFQITDSQLFKRLLIDYMNNWNVPVDDIRNFLNIDSELQKIVSCIRQTNISNIEINQTLVQSLKYHEYIKAYELASNKIIIYK